MSHENMGGSIQICILEAIEGKISLVVRLYILNKDRPGI